MNRLNLFESSAQAVERLLKTYPNSMALRSVKEQLQYLLDVEAGRTTDFSKLSQINVGVLAAKEIEDVDEAVAVKLYEVSAEVARMLQN